MVFHSYRDACPKSDVPGEISAPDASAPKNKERSDYIFRAGRPRTASRARPLGLPRVDCRASAAAPLNIFFALKRCWHACSIDRRNEDYRDARDKAKGEKNVRSGGTGSGCKARHRGRRFPLALSHFLRLWGGIDPYKPLTRAFVRFDGGAFVRVLTPYRTCLISHIVTCPIPVGHTVFWTRCRVRGVAPIDESRCACPLSYHAHVCAHRAERISRGCGRYDRGGHSSCHSQARNIGLKNIPRAGTMREMRAHARRPPASRSGKGAMGSRRGRHDRGQRRTGSGTGLDIFLPGGCAATMTFIVIGITRA